MKRRIALLSVLLLGAVPVLAAGALWTTSLATELPADPPAKQDVQQPAATVSEAPTCKGNDEAVSPDDAMPPNPPCYVSYCKAPGVRCVFNRRTGCGCKYVSQVDMTCTEGEAPPPDFCVCT